MIAWAMALATFESSSVTSSRTGYWPSAAKEWLTVAPLPVLVSPKSQS